MIDKPHEADPHSAEPVAWTREDFSTLVERARDHHDDSAMIDLLREQAGEFYAALLAANQRAEKAEEREKLQRELRASDTDLLRGEVIFARADRDAAEARANSLAAKLAEAKAKIADLEAALSDVLRNEYDGNGLTDCIDNDGHHYQSQGLANAIARAEAALSNIDKEP